MSDRGTSARPAPGGAPGARGLRLAAIVAGAAVLLAGAVMLARAGRGEAVATAHGPPPATAHGPSPAAVTADPRPATPQSRPRPEPAAPAAASPEPAPARSTAAPAAAERQVYASVEDWLENGPKEPLVPPVVELQVKLAPRAPVTAEPLVPTEIVLDAPEAAPRAERSNEPLIPPVVELTDEDADVDPDPDEVP